MYSDDITITAPDNTVTQDYQAENAEDIEWAKKQKTKEEASKQRNSLRNTISEIWSQIEPSIDKDFGRNFDREDEHRYVVKVETPNIPLVGPKGIKWDVDTFILHHLGPRLLPPHSLHIHYSAKATDNILVVIVTITVE